MDPVDIRSLEEAAEGGQRPAPASSTPQHHDGHHQSYIHDEIKNHDGNNGNDSTGPKGKLTAHVRGAEGHQPTQEEGSTSSPHAYQPQGRGESAGCDDRQCEFSYEGDHQFENLPHVSERPVG